MKLFLLNPRVEWRKSRFDPGPGVGVVVVDCPCGCNRPYPLFPTATWTPDVNNPPTNPGGWNTLFSTLSYPGTVFRVATDSQPCGWLGTITDGKVYSIEGVENDNKFGVDPTGTLEKLAQGGIVQASISPRR